MLSRALQNGPPSLTELERSSASHTKKGRSFEYRRRSLRRSAVGARRMPLSTACSMDAGLSLSIWSRALPGEPVPCSVALDSGRRTRWTRLWSRRPSISAAQSLRREIRRTSGDSRQVFATCECLRFEISGHSGERASKGPGRARAAGRDTNGTRRPRTPLFSRTSAQKATASGAVGQRFESSVARRVPWSDGFADILFAVEGA